jgi:hypothetical protein
MADNILSHNIQNLHRIDVVFQIEEKYSHYNVEISTVLLAEQDT